MCLFCVYIITTPKFTLWEVERDLVLILARKEEEKNFFFPFICVYRLKVAATPENENIRISNLNFQVEFSD